MPELECDLVKTVTSEGSCREPEYGINCCIDGALPVNDLRIWTSALRRHGREEGKRGACISGSCFRVVLNFRACVLALSLGH